MKLISEAESLAEELDAFTGQALDPVNRLQAWSVFLSRFERFSRRATLQRTAAAGAGMTPAPGAGGRDAPTRVVHAVQEKSRRLVHLHADLLERIKPLRRAFRLAAAREWILSGRMDAALAECEREVCLEPQNSAEWKALFDESHTGAKGSQAVRFLESRRFDVLWSRSAPEIGRFGAVMHHAEAGCFFATDRVGRAVVRIGQDGSPATRLPLECVEPIGLAYDRSGDLWICDAGAKKLITASPEGRLIREFFLPELLGDDKVALPRRLCIQEGVVHIRATDASGEQARLIRLDPGPPPAARVLKNLGTFEPGLGADAATNRLAQSCEALYARLSGTASFWEGRTDIGPLCQYQLLGDFFYLNCSSHIVKMSIAGDLVFSVDMRRVFGPNKAKIGWMHAWAEEQGGRLVVVSKNAPHMCLFSV